MVLASPDPFVSIRPMAAKSYSVAENLPSLMDEYNKHML